VKFWGSSRTITGGNTSPTRRGEVCKGPLLEWQGAFGESIFSKKKSLRRVTPVLQGGRTT